MLTPSEILELLPADNKYNLHTHTQFCDGRHSMEMMVNGAIEADMKVIGFTPHSPVPIESPCNMLRVDVNEYLSEINRLRDEYGERITILRSMEIDYLGKDWGPSNPYFDSLPLDYRMGSVHFIPSVDGQLVDIDGSSDSFMRNMPIYFDNDIDYVINAYFDAGEEMVAQGHFQVIGHFDKVLLNARTFDANINESQLYRRRVDRLIESIAEAGIIAEINTKHYEPRGLFFPGIELWPKLKRAGVPVIINSDAHYSNLINAGRDRALELLG